MSLAQVQTGARLAAAEALAGYRDSVPAPARRPMKHAPFENPPDSRNSSHSPTEAARLHLHSPKVADASCPIANKRHIKSSTLIKKPG